MEWNTYMTCLNALGRTNVTRAVGEETRTGLSLAPISVERQPAQCSAHFCGMADYSTVRLTVPPYAVRAFSLPALPREHANACTTYRSTDCSTRLFRKRMVDDHLRADVAEVWRQCKGLFSSETGNLFVRRTIHWAL